MNTLTVQHTSRQVAANDDYKSVNRQLHQVARWVESIPDLTGGVPYWDRLLPALQHRKAEIDALMATDGYKQAIAMLTPLAAPPHVRYVSQQIVDLIDSKPFGHTLADGYSALLIRHISEIDPPPSIAAVMVAFHEMILTPGQNPPDVGTAVLCIEESQRRFEAKYRPLLELEECGRKVAIRVTEVAKEERGRADPIKQAVASARQQAGLEEWNRKREEEKRKDREEEQRKLEEKQKKLHQIAASGRLDTLMRDLREAHRAVLKEQSNLNATRVNDLLRELGGIEKMLNMDWIAGPLETRITNAKQRLEKWVMAQEDEERRKEFRASTLVPRSGLDRLLQDAQ